MYNGVLTALTHLHGDLASGLCVHSPRRQPKGACRAASQYRRSMAPYQLLVLGRMNLCAKEYVLRRDFDFQEILFARTAKKHLRLAGISMRFSASQSAGCCSRFRTSGVCRILQSDVWRGRVLQFHITLSGACLLPLLVLYAAAIMPLGARAYRMMNKKCGAGVIARADATGVALVASCHCLSNRQIL